MVREPAQLEPIEGEWSRFAGRLERVTPFQLPEWQITWWRHFGMGRLHVMLFRSLDSLVAIVPCYLDPTENGSALKLVGSGIASYLEPPIAPAHRVEVMNLLRGHLLGNTAWSTCDWQNVEINSPLAGLQLGEPFDLKILPDGQWFEIAIQGTFQQYWESRAFSLRRNFLKYLDQPSGADRPRLEVVTQADPEFVNAVIRLEIERSAVFSHAKDGAPAFLVDLTRAFDDADMLRIFGLRLNRKIVAVMLAFVYRNTLYSFAGGHEAEFEAQGFGRLLLFEALRHAFEQGYRAWNFLSSNEPYKLLWGARTASTARLTISRKAGFPS